MRLVLLAILFTVPTIGAEVYQVGTSGTMISITHEVGKKWKENDGVCVIQGWREIVCGVVIKVTDKLAIVKLKNQNNEISRGDKVRFEPTAAVNTRAVAPVAAATPAQPDRKPAAKLLQSVTKDDVLKQETYCLSGGFSVGNGFYFPLIHFERMVAPKISVGVMPVYFNVSGEGGSLSSFGGLLTGNYYSLDSFHGLWVSAGGGVHFLSSTVGAIEQQSTSPVFIGTVGWRGSWDLGLNVGVAAGLQYLKDPGFTNMKLSGAGIQPLVLLDLGFAF